MKRPYLLGLAIRFVFVILYLASIDPNAFSNKLLHPAALIDSILIWWFVGFFVVPYLDIILFGVIFFFWRKKQSVSTAFEALVAGILAGVITVVGSFVVAFILGLLSSLLHLHF